MWVLGAMPCFDAEREGGHDGSPYVKAAADQRDHSAPAGSPFGPLLGILLASAARAGETPAVQQTLLSYWRTYV